MRLQEADFFSFGTNDLTQMTFGFSRDDAGKFLDAYYDRKIYENDPFAKLDQAGVGRLVEMACKLGRSTNPELHLYLRRARRRSLLRGVLPRRGSGLCVLLPPSVCPIARLAAAQAAIKNPPQVRVLSFTIGFDEAQTFYKSHGYGIKPSKWHDLTVEVYI